MKTWKMQQTLINNRFILEKAAGKGGWTYVLIPGIRSTKGFSFNKTRLKGTIDKVEVKHCRLMPTGEEKLFLPVNATIRKQLRKKAGDWVNIVLFIEDAPVEIPADFLLCLEDDQPAYSFFLSCTDGQKQGFINHINAAKTDNTRISRIAKALNKLAKGEKYP
jgi:hypothetical protein